jgi:hypothetical protein
VTRLERLPTIAVLGLAFAAWALGFFLVSSLFQDIGYLAFLRWKMISPTLITLFLYLRSLRRERRSHVAWLATLAVVVALGRQVWLAYEAMDDAPRGLLWDAYQFEALALGTGTYWLCTALAALMRRANVA